MFLIDFLVIWKVILLLKMNTSGRMNMFVSVNSTVVQYGNTVS